MSMTRNGVDGYEEKGLGIWDDADPVANLTTMNKCSKYEQQEKCYERNVGENLK